MNKEQMMNIGILEPSKGVGVITDRLVSTVDHETQATDRAEILMSNESIDKRLNMSPALIVNKVWLGRLSIKTFPLYKTKVKKVKTRAKSKRRRMVTPHITKVKNLRSEIKYLGNDRSDPGLGVDPDLMALYKKFKVENGDHKAYSLDNILSEDVFKKVEDKRPQSELTMKAEFNFSKVAEAVWEESSNPFGKKDKDNG